MASINAEIVMIGTELLLGQIVDTNATHIGRVLADNGINLFQKTTVGDNRQRIIRVLDDALNRAPIVLTSGGLGPTEDDITRDCVAELCGRPLEFRQELYDQLAARFARFRRPISENNRRQAFAPRGAIAVENPNGTAPGLIVEEPRGVIACMPGVPHELKAMLDDSIIPYLRRTFGLEGTLQYRVLKVCGVGESSVDAAISDLILSCENPKIGLLASPESVRIRISARAGSAEEANAMIDEVDRQVRDRLPGLVMGIDDAVLEGVVDELLCRRGWRIALAEVHTGGLVAQRFSAAARGSFAGGLVVPDSGLGSEAPGFAAQRLAEEARSRFGAECALAVVPQAAEDSAHLLLLTPEGRKSWDVGYASADDPWRLRTAVVCMEHLRRYLIGALVC